MPPSRMDVQRALNTLLQDRDAPTLNYAVNYAEHALTIHDPYELAVQLQYVLNNMTHWRHPNARRVRQTFKQYVVEHM